MFSRPSGRQRTHSYCWAIGFVAITLTSLYLGISNFSHYTSSPSPVTSASTGKYSRCETFLDDCETTAPFIFDSIYSLAKQWPNTYAPNGHSIVPAILPANMQLYHAKQYEGVMKKPTWFAFDAEMCIGIYGGSGRTLLHTVILSQPLTLLYFDGESATLTATGSLDSQTALLRDGVELEPSYDFTYNETARGDELCALAGQLGIDGYMRMNAGFEALICDIDAAKIREVFVTNLTVPGNEVRENDPTLPQDPNRQPPLGFGNTFTVEYGWDWVRSAAWHYGGFGNSGGGYRESRVDLDFCGMITYYDPLLQSLSGKHKGGIHGKEHYENGWGLRRGHRLLEITSADVAKVKDWVQQALRRHHTPSWLESILNIFQPIPKCSGTNWQGVTETIMDTHRSRAVEIAEVFRRFRNGSLAKDAMFTQVHKLSHAILATYFEYPRGDALTLSQSKEQTIFRCSSLFVSYLLPGSYNTFEGLLKDSVKIVLDRLCRWEWDLFEWSENRTTDLFQKPTARAKERKEQVTLDNFDYYHLQTENILNWLGWLTWTDCPTKCAIGEICYIPMWPVIYSNGTRQGSIYAGDILDADEERYFWSPKCISREMWAKAGGRGREPKYQIPDVPGNERDGNRV